MQAKWIDRTVEIKDEEWDRFAKPGIYILIRKRSIPRIAKTDRNGILYIGQAFNIAKRLDLFHSAEHKTSYLFYLQPKLADLVFKKKIRGKDAFYRTLGKVRVRIACPIKKKELNTAERACLFTYYKIFGELPPYNANFSHSKTPKPKESALRWAKKGISMPFASFSPHKDTFKKK